MADEFAPGFAELFDHRSFQIVGLDDSVARKRFTHHFRQLGAVHLQRAAGTADFPAVNHDRHQAQRQHHHRDQRQPGLLPQQADQQGGEGDGVLHDNGRGAADDALERVGVAQGAGDQLAAARAAEEAGGQVEQMREQADAQVRDGADGSPLKKVNVQVGEKTAQKNHRGNRPDQHDCRARMRVEARGQRFLCRLRPGPHKQGGPIEPLAQLGSTGSWKDQAVNRGDRGDHEWLDQPGQDSGRDPQQQPPVVGSGQAPDFEDKRDHVTARLTLDRILWTRRRFSERGIYSASGPDGLLLANPSIY